MKLLGKNQQKRNATAITMIELMVVIAIIVILAGLLLPAFSGRHKQPSRMIRCMSNLRQVGIGFYLWADDNGGKFPTQTSVTNGGTMEFVSDKSAFVHFLKLSNYLHTPNVFICPADSNHIAAVDFKSGFVDRNLSYFVGADATRTISAILSGDRNLTLNGVLMKRGLVEILSNSHVGFGKNIHPPGGNFLFGDTHVEYCRSNTVSQKFQATGLATNRLLLP